MHKIEKDIFFHFFLVILMPRIFRKHIMNKQFDPVVFYSLQSAREVLVSHVLVEDFERQY